MVRVEGDAVGDGPARVPLQALLFLPPTRPRGGPPLSLATVAAWLAPALQSRIVDLNTWTGAEVDALLADPAPPALCGISVCAQTLPDAVALTARLKAAWPGTPVAWGGELPTLLPDLCRAHADTIVRGRFEPLAAALVADLLAGRLRRAYGPARPATRPGPRPPALDRVEHRDRYPDLLGLPLETSQGCNHGCSFCLVHTMQRHAGAYPLEAVEADLRANPRPRASLVDYNLGMDRDHLLGLCGVLERAGVRGWNAEMCVESLDDDEVLEALARSRCLHVYCGLEAVEREALLSVGKRHNRAGDYARIIRRAQARGIQVAGGFIVGMKGTTAAAFERYLAFAEDTGLLYLKLTHLTFNPGTRVHAAMEARGTYRTRDVTRFDGNHPVFLYPGVDPAVLEAGVRLLVDRFYSPESAQVRSRHLAHDPAARDEFLRVSEHFGRFYREPQR